MSANQADLSVDTICLGLHVSAGGYDAWCQRAPSAQAMVNGASTERIRAIQADSDGPYCMPRVHAELIGQG